MIHSNVKNKDIGMNQLRKQQFQILGFLPCFDKLCINGVLFEEPNKGGTIYKCTQCSKTFCILCREQQHNFKCKFLIHEQENIKKFTCQNCCEEKQYSTKIGFCECGFQMCLECYNSFLKTSIEKMQIPKCPSGCNKVLKSSLRNYLDDDSTKKFNKIIHNKVLKDDGLKPCQKQQCDGFLIQFVDSNNNIKKKCAQCESKYCSRCLEFQHTGLCNKLAQIEMMKKFQYRICNSCQNAVQKSQGCDHIVCKCGYKFCYACEQQISPSHQCPSFRSSQRQRRIKKLSRQQKKLRQKYGYEQHKQERKPCKCQIF